MTTTRYEPCPECGELMAVGYRPDPTDPDDVDPAARCLNPSGVCDFGY